MLSQTLEELYSGFCACRAILQVKNIYILLAEGPGDARGKKLLKNSFEKTFRFFQPLTPPGHP